MTNIYLFISSFFVAFVVVLGGAPMLRRLAHLARPDVVRSNNDAVPIGVGGALILLALLLDSFYLLPLPDTASNLLVAILAVLVFRGILWYRLPAARASFWSNVLALPVLLFIMMVIIGLPKALIFDSALVVRGWFGFLLTVGFAGAITLLPIALAHLGDDRPGQGQVGTPYLVVPSMLGILILSLNAALNSADGVAAVNSILHVFLPCLGAVAGITFYSLRMPWRPRQLVCMGASGQMVGGLAVAWAAILIAAAAPRPGLAMASLVWMLFPALFEVAREQIRQRIVPNLDASQVDQRLLASLNRPARPAIVYAMTVAMVVIGLCVFWIPDIRIWKTGVALPFAFALYLVLGGWATKPEAAAIATRKLKARNS